MTKTPVAIRKNKTSTAYSRCKQVGCVISTIGIAVYLVALVFTITQTAQKKQLARTVRDQATKVAQLEQSYYQAVGTITLASAQDTGYQIPATVRYGSLHPDKALALSR